MERMFHDKGNSAEKQPLRSGHLSTVVMFSPSLHIYLFAWSLAFPVIGVSRPDERTTEDGHLVSLCFRQSRFSGLVSLAIVSPKLEALHPDSTLHLPSTSTPHVGAACHSASL